MSEKSFSPMVQIWWNSKKGKVVSKRIKECCEEEKYEEIWVTFGTTYLGNCWADSFQI